MFSNLSDLRMRDYKVGNFWMTHPWRCLANISAVYDGRPDSTIMLEEMLSLIKSNAGERGIVNIGHYEDKDMRLNPCQPKDAVVYEEHKGLINFGALNVGDRIWSKEGWTTVVDKWSTGHKQTYKYKTAYGEFYGTENHKVVEDGEKIEVKDAVFLDVFPSPAQAFKPVTAIIDEKEDTGVQEVFDITVDNPSHTYWTNGVDVSNCAERILKPFQFCNLSEVVVTKDITVQELAKRVEYATLLGTIQATLTKFNHDVLREEWKTHTEEDALLGVSFTGTANIDWNADLLQLLKSIAETSNEKFAEELGINKAAGITCLKPSGCQPPETLVLSDRGILTLDEIGDVDGDTWQNIDMSVSQEKNDAKATKFFVNGKAMVKKLIMKSGAVLTSTLNHQYRVLEKGEYVWKSSEDIEVGAIVPYKVGDYEGGSYQKLMQVAMPYCNCGKITMPEYLDEEFAFFLGMYAGDGSTHKKSIRIAGNNYNKLDSMNRIQGMFQEKFGLTTEIYERTKSYRNADLFINSTWLLAFMRANDLIKKDTYNLSIPLIVRKSPKSVLQSFVDGYVAADGHVCSDGSGRIILCTVSKRMADEMLVVWRALGKYAKVTEMPPTETSWGKAMRYRIETNKGRDGDVAKVSTFKNLAKYVKQLDSLGLTNLFPDEVVAIDYDESETYDIEVPQNNTYIANSYVSHNSVSQLVGVSAGIHPEYAPYFIRRIRIAAIDPLCTLLREQGVPHSKEVGEEDKEVPTSYVFEFPIKGHAKRMRGGESAVEQLEIYKLFKTAWCDERGNPSCTIYVRKEEWIQVVNWVYDNFDLIGGVSFLPYDNGVYKLAPYEEISEDKFNELCESFPKVDLSKLPEYENEDYTVGAKELSCVGGSCELI